MRPEYDFSGAVRDKYYERFQKSSNVVLLEPDVSAAFPNSASVNKALRALASVARRSGRVVRRPASPRRRPNKGEAARPSTLISSLGMNPLRGRGIGSRIHP